MMYGGQTELTCALAKVFHSDVLVPPTGNGAQLALVSVGHPIRATHLLGKNREQKEARITTC